MQNSNVTLRLISPVLGHPPQSEAQVLGAVTWLLMNSARHSGLTLRMLAGQVVPAVQTGQYILLGQRPAGADGETAAETPIAWVAWANFGAVAEACYLSDHMADIHVDGWRSGDRMWFIHWVAPFGHTSALRRAVLDYMPDSCARALHHRGIERGTRVNTYRGKNISPERARQWWRQRPMLAAPPAAPDTRQRPAGAAW